MLQPLLPVDFTRAISAYTGRRLRAPSADPKGTRQRVRRSRCRPSDGQEPCRQNACTGRTRRFRACLEVPTLCGELVPPCVRCPRSQMAFVRLPPKQRHDVRTELESGLTRGDSCANRTPVAVATDRRRHSACSRRFRQRGARLGRVQRRNQRHLRRRSCIRGCSGG